MRKLVRVTTGATLALLSLCATAHAQSTYVPLADPAVLGPHPVSFTDYGSMDQVQQFGGAPGEIYARVLFPSDLDNGPYPLVLLVHGDHVNCMQPSGASAPSAWPCPAPQVPVHNHWGFVYLAEILASHGIIAATLSANGAIAASNALGTAPREALINYHLGNWWLFNTSGDSFTYFDGHEVTGSIEGAVDLSKVALVGHSQGGSSIMAFATNPAYSTPYWQIRALVPMAPASAPAVNNIPVASILSYCDGDVEDLHGVRLLDNVRYNEPSDVAEKYVFTLPGGNHNFFNAMWSPDYYFLPNSPPPPHARDEAVPYYGGDSHCDPAVSGNGRLTGFEQRAVGQAYAVAFLRKYLRGETQFDSYLRGDVAPPPSLLTAETKVSYHPPATERRDLNRLDDQTRFDANQNTLGGTINTASLSKYELCEGDDCLVQERRGNSYLRLAISWDSTSARYYNALPSGQRDVSAFATLQFRFGIDDNDARNGGANQDFQVRLEDGTGERVYVSVADFTNALEFPPGVESRTGSSNDVRMSLMTTVRIPMAMFIDLNLGDIRSVDLVFNQESSGAIFVSDLAFVDGTNDKDYFWLSDGGGDFESANLALARGYRPFAGNFDAEDGDDIFLYAPGTGKDIVLWADGDDLSADVSLPGVSGTYIPLVGDFDGDGGDDIFWYVPGSTADGIWWSDGDGTFTTTTVSVNGTYSPMVGDFDGDGADDVFWYGPGSASDGIWWSDGDRTFTAVTLSVGGTYRPAWGDFDGDGATDIFWYAPGSSADYIWWADGDRTFSNGAINVSGSSYHPFAGDFDGDGYADIFWYGPGSAGDRIWWANGARSWSSSTPSVGGNYAPTVLDLDGFGGDDILWYSP